MFFSSGSRMKDLVSCYSDHAVKVSDSSCSGSVRSQLPSSSTRDTAALQGSISCLYRTKLTSCPFKEFLIRITWSKSLIGLGLSIAVDEEAGTGSNCSSPMLILRKKKGVRPYTSSGGSTIVLYWDITAAKYGSGPEPLEGFYVVVVVDSEFGLLLGDTTAIQDQIIGLAGSDIPTTQSYLLSRREQALGSSLFSTRVRFRKNGKDHDIAIRCKEDTELSVCIDKKKVVHVKRLRWNFRGNQTIFVDGMPVDMMWDVHDWWFGGSRNDDNKVSGGGGHAVFMFRTRSGLESRLWLEEELLQTKFPSGTGDYGFSLLIHAYKSSSSSSPSSSSQT